MSRIGIHARNDTAFQEADYLLLRQARIETLKIMSHTGLPTLRRLCSEFPELEIIVRLYDPALSRAEPDAFVGRMVPVIQERRPFATKFEIHNEPNHVSGCEGWGATDEDARDFLSWYLHVLVALRRACPWARFGFPGLALHWPHRDLEWLEICRPAVLASSWLGCHCYWQYGNMLSDDWGLRFKLYHQRFPDKRIEITEFGNSTPDLSPDEMARQYVQYYQALRPYPYLGSASSFIASSPDPQWALFAWRDENGTMRPVVRSVGEMDRTEPLRIVDITEHLPRNGSYPQRQVSDIRFCVLHHAVTPNQDRIGSLERVKGIAAYHIRRWGWPGIGYHFVIARDGTIYQTNALTSVSNHAYGANLHGVGICLLGTYTRDRPPDAQVEAAAWLLRKLGWEWYDHKHWGKTTCPGVAGDVIRESI